MAEDNPLADSKATYERFLTLARNALIFISIVLVGMAIFLV